MHSVISGTDWDDTLVGSSGDDSIYGAGGNDYVDFSPGSDAVFGGTGDDTLFGTFLYGGEGNDHLWLSTASGAASGGDGDDTYYLSQIEHFVYWDQGISIRETEFGGTDTVVTYFGTVNLSLTPWIENIVILGLRSTSATGNELANTITGNNSSNAINGGAGADTLIGNKGNDVYTVDDIGDVIVEKARGGVDTVQAAVSYVLANMLENLTLIGGNNIDGTGNALANVLTGNTAANWLFGGDGADSLSGGLGADTLEGGAGNDIYYQISTYDSGGSNLFDTISEDAGGGYDTVIVASNVGRFTYILDANVENLTVIGSDIFRLWGNSLANILTGNDAYNIFDGFGGRDILIGSLGIDEFHFSALAAASSDKILDFTSGEDQIHISAAAFGGGLASGDAARLVVGDAPVPDPIWGTAGQFLYNSTKGKLFFDADGTGAGAAVLFATLVGQPFLDSADLVIIA